MVLDVGDQLARRRGRGRPGVHLGQDELEVVEQLLARRAGHRQAGVALVGADCGTGARPRLAVRRPGPVAVAGELLLDAADVGLGDARGHLVDGGVDGEEEAAAGIARRGPEVGPRLRRRGARQRHRHRHRCRGGRPCRRRSRQSRRSRRLYDRESHAALRCQGSHSMTRHYMTRYAASPAAAIAPAARLGARAAPR